jgi:beta-glucosidase
VVSDWGATSELIPHGYASNRKSAAEISMLAGCDIDMESRCYVDYLSELIKAGIVPEQLIDNAVRRILVTKFQLGLFEDPFRFSNSIREKEAFENPSHRQFAKEIAEKSIVLLKNENKTLPIKKQYKKIALIGPLAKSKKDMKGFWSIPWNDDELVSVYEGLRTNLPNETILTYAKGCDINSADKSGFTEAIQIAKEADLVIMTIGESYDMSGEARSRANINIPGVQEELVKSVKQAIKAPVVVLIMAGRPLTFNWIAENTNSILYTWWLGSEAGNAISNVLCGNYNPSAKLPITFPRSVGQIPIYYNMKSTGRPALNDEDFVYKSAYIDMSNKPLYAFGHGLSYTTFEYSDLSLSSTKMENADTIIVRYKVKNTGSIDGEEITQLYINDNFASVTRPTKELKGFEKVKIKSGESKQLEFKIHKEMLSFYSQAMKWQTEPGTFELMIGSSSDRIHLKSNFELINSK